MPKALANFSSTNATAYPSSTSIELVCPVTTLSTLRMAVDNGADWVCLEVEEHNEDDKRNCIDFNNQATLNSIRYAHDRQCKVLLSLAIRAQLPTWNRWRDAIDDAASAGVDAFALSDPALMLYATAQYPQISLHYATAESATNSESITFFLRQFKISRIALPRALSLAQLARIAHETPAELQVSGFCLPSPAIETGNRSIKKISKTSSPPSCIEFRYDESTKEVDTVVEHCAATEDAANDSWFAIEHVSDIRILQLLPQLGAFGVRAIRIETSGQHPAQAVQTMRVWRKAIDKYSENTERYSVKPSWLDELNKTTRHLPPLLDAPSHIVCSLGFAQE